jgi:D-proline reductase (dithiol) PrdB
MDLKSIEANVHRTGYSDFHFINNKGKQIPFINLNKPISECKIAFISSGGFHLKTEEPFDTEAPLGDITFRKIPSNATIKELSIAHAHYNHKYAIEDLNCALPLESLKQLEEEKSIGKLAEVNYSFCGFVLNLDGLKQDLSMQIARDLQKQQVDAVILAPV